MKAGDIEISSTTPDVKEITLPDIEYVDFLVMKELIQAIKDLTLAIRGIK